MAASDEWTEWHLTPRGWERGSERVDVGNVTPRDPPADRVLTVRYREYSSWGANLTVYQDELWRSPDVESVDSLLRQFCEAPRSL